ncbi:hypothetical protein RQP46_006600 [Phenoliferia psychrophenolica]
MRSTEKEFPTLPTETWIEILTEHGLSYHDLKRVAGVSRAFKAIIESSPLDALLFRGTPHSVLQDGTEVLLHPALDAWNLIETSYKKFEIRDATLTKTWKIHDLACVDDFATSPPVCGVELFNFGERYHDGHDDLSSCHQIRQKGVRVVDVLKRIARRWNEAPDPEEVHEMNEISYDDYTETLDLEYEWEPYVVDTCYDLLRDHGPAECYWDGWEPVDINQNGVVVLQPKPWTSERPEVHDK